MQHAILSVIVKHELHKAFPVTRVRVRTHEDKQRPSAVHLAKKQLIRDIEDRSCCILTQQPKPYIVGCGRCTFEMFA